MKEILRGFLKIDRRWIFLFVLLGVLIPLATGKGLHHSYPGNEVKLVYNFIENLQPGDIVMLSMDYDPATIPELDPMSRALLRHCFNKGVRVMALTLHPAGAGICIAVIDELLAEYSQPGINPDGSERPARQYGQDIVFMGYKPGTDAVMLGMGEDVRLLFPQDYAGTEIPPYHGDPKETSLPMMCDVKNYNDVKCVITISGTRMPEYWVAYAYQRYHVKIATGVTAVMFADYYPYLQTGQMIGLIPGMKGAADYEELINHPDRGMVGMLPQSIIHLLIVAFIILGNIAFFIVRREDKQEGKKGGKKK